MEDLSTRLSFLKRRYDEIEKEILDLKYKEDSLKLERDALPPPPIDHFLKPRVFETNKTWKKRSMASNKMRFKRHDEINKKILKISDQLSSLYIQQGAIFKEMEEISKQLKQ